MKLILASLELFFNIESSFVVSVNQKLAISDRDHFPDFLGECCLIVLADQISLAQVIDHAVFRVLDEIVVLLVSDELPLCHFLVILFK